MATICALIILSFRYFFIKKNSDLGREDVYFRFIE